MPNDIKYENIMFLSFAEEDANGTPGEVVIFLNDLNYYTFNYIFGTKIEEIYKIFPPLEKLSLSFGKVDNLDNSWKYIDMGLGNYLFIRKELFENFEKLLNVEANNQKITKGFIFQKWRDIAKNVLLKTEDISNNMQSNIDKEYEYYSKLYSKKFGKKAFIANPSGSKEQTIYAIKKSLEANKDLLGELLNPNEEENLY